MQGPGKMQFHNITVGLRDVPAIDLHDSYVLSTIDYALSMQLHPWKFDNFLAAATN